MAVTTKKSFTITDHEPDANSSVRIEPNVADDGSPSVQILQDNDKVYLRADHARAFVAALTELLADL